MNALKINFLARAKNKYFWLALIPAIILLVQMVAALFGWQLDLSDLQGKLIAIVDALFGLLVVIGVINDPTTEGLKDSAQAMTYTEPKKSDHESA
jgi:phi LC3 family holin